ncbi:MAG: flagellar basal body-associated FliL family protein [Candidatus Zixiibacteriota bacterium]|nr:MAG: flagellar basal body-associated FliL family protein [candidate division Zixibacteria bacterium]
MPADDEKTTVEVGEETVAEEGTERGGNSKLFLFGGIGLGVVLLGIVLALFVVRPMMAGSDGGSTTDTEEVAAANDKEPEEKPKPKPKKKSRKGQGEASQSVVYSIQDIVVNPAGTGGSRFLSVSFGFDLASAEMAQEFEGREPLVRDALITILSSKTVAQLTDVKQKEVIRYQIKKRVSQLLDTDEIEGVYYTDFVLQ